jgi:hypothetical protein
LPNTPAFTNRKDFAPAEAKARMGIGTEANPRRVNRPKDPTETPSDRHTELVMEENVLPRAFRDVVVDGVNSKSSSLLASSSDLVLMKVTLGLLARPRTTAALSPTPNRSNPRSDMGPPR